ncbi:alpha carbonic anhydrase 7-like [Aristolochia californica]|uniref:alpha carbonic anhydrase 7-like n=1 Tax=Aristolochia californica TaxID=171875 RepID=UPI0035DF6B38
MANATTRLIFCCSVLFVVLNSGRSNAQEVENEREFDYNEASSKGPQQWGEIHKEWADCKKGQMQSPIDLSGERVEIVPKLGRLKRSYKPSIAKLKNRGHDIMLEWIGEAGWISINGTEYELQQCHWHSPSEHTINGRRFDLEAHMVHKSSDGRLAVVGIMYKIGRPDTFLTELMEGIGSIMDTHDGEREVGVVDPRHIKIGSRKYYRYIGSLTVPPCTEGVVWTMIRKVRTVSREQIRLLREAVHDYAEKNARPIQLPNRCPVQIYRPN